MDAELLEEAAQVLGDTALETQGTRRRLREGFWKRIKQGLPT